MGANENPSPLWPRWAPYAALVCLTLLTDVGGLGGDFISDDWPMIAENSYLESGARISRFFTHGIWQSSGFQLERAEIYRPLYLLWYWGIYSVAGPSSYGFHVALLGVHVLNVLLLFALLERLVPRAPLVGRVIASTLFALHPAHTQVIGWVSGGTDAVAGAFLLPSLLLYLKSRERGSPLLLGASCLLFAGAALVKETALFFAVVPAVCDLRGGARPRDLLAGRHGGFLFVAIAVLVIRSLVVENPSLIVTAEGFYRLAEQVCLSVRYSLLPWPLPFFFGYPEGGIAGLLDLAIGLAGLGLAAVVFIRSPPSRFGLVWIALALAPTLPLAFHAQGVFALRFLYLPLMGAALLVAECSARIPAERRALVAAAGAVVGISFAVGSVVGLRDWRDEEVFFAKLERETPGAVWGYEGLGRHYARTGQLAEALAAYRRGIEGVTATEDRFALAKRLGLQYAGLGRFRDALEAYELMNRIAPGAEALVGIGNCRWQLGETEGALAAFRQAIEADPGNSLALANHAQLSASLGREEQARASYERLLDLPAERVDPRAAARARAFLDVRRRFTPDRAADGTADGR